MLNTSCVEPLFVTAFCPEVCQLKSQQPLSRFAVFMTGSRPYARVPHGTNGPPRPKCSCPIRARLVQDTQLLDAVLRTVYWRVKTAHSVAVHSAVTQPQKQSSLAVAVIVTSRHSVIVDSSQREVKLQTLQRGRVATIEMTRRTGYRQRLCQRCGVPRPDTARRALALAIL